MKSLITTTTQMSIPKDYKAAGFGHRYWSNEQIKQYKPEIVLFLVANLGTKKGINPSFPIPQEVYDAKSDSFVRGKDVDLSHIFVNMNLRGRKDNKGDMFYRKLKYLDLKTYTVVPALKALMDIITGVDGGFMNGVKVPDKKTVPYLVPIEISNPQEAFKYPNTGVPLDRFIAGKSSKPVPMKKPVAKGGVKPSGFIGASAGVP